MWTLRRLADYLAEETGLHISFETVRRKLAKEDILFSRPQHTISSPDPDYQVKKKTIEETRDGLKSGEVFYYADEFNVSWLPPLRAMWIPPETGHDFALGFEAYGDRDSIKFDGA